MIEEEEDEDGEEEANEDEEAKGEEILEIEGIEKKPLVVNESSRVAIFGREKRRRNCQRFITYPLLGFLSWVDDGSGTGSSGYQKSRLV